MSLLRYSFILTLLVVLSDKALGDSEKPHYDLKDAEKLYSEYRVKYNKEYKTAEELERHYEAFVVTLLRVNYYNKINEMSVFDINHLSDETEEETKRRFIDFSKDKYKVM